MSSYDPARFPGRAPNAVDFLRTTAHALPRTLGDRDTIAAMSVAMQLAIDTGMQFSLADRDALRDLVITRQVGIFDPFWDGFYRHSCIMGGTYARLYESHNGFRPWIAPLVYRPTLGMERCATYAQAVPIERNTRAAEGFALFVPEAAQQDDSNLAFVDQSMSFSVDRGARFDWDQRYAVWYCTTLKQDEVILCRYPQGPNSPLERTGPPARRVRLARESWADWFGPAQAEAAQSRPRERSAPV